MGCGDMIGSGDYDKAGKQRSDSEQEGFSGGSICWQHTVSSFLRTRYVPSLQRSVRHMSLTLVFI